MNEPYGSDIVVIGDEWELIEDSNILDEDESGYDEPELPIN